MNPILEELIKALDEFLSDPTNRQKKQRYNWLLDDFLDKNPGLNRASIESAIRHQHRAWRKAQKQPTTLPPNA
jgi:hypothetical protein